MAASRFQQKGVVRAQVVMNAVIFQRAVSARNVCQNVMIAAVTRNIVFFRRRSDPRNVDDKGDVFVGSIYEMSDFLVDIPHNDVFAAEKRNVGHNETIPHGNDRFQH